MWNPIIRTPSLKQHIIEKVEEIYEILIRKEQEIDSFDVYMGRSGIYLFLLYYNLTKKENCRKIDHIFESIIDQASNWEIKNHAELTFYAEVAYLMCHMYEIKELDISINDYLSEIDEALYEEMLMLLKTKEYGCVNGAISIGIYFLYRNIIYKDKFKCELENMVDLLYDISEKTYNGIAFVNIVEYGSYTEGYNLGIAHGMPGLLLFLSKLYSCDIRKDKVYEMIIGLMNFLMSKKHSLNFHKTYFYNIITDDPQLGHDSRLAWCYGDLSVGYAIFKASILNGVKRLDITKEILDMLINTTKRKNKSENGIVDAGLCHGTSGIAHIYNRLYQQTGMLDFKESALFWYNETLNMSIYKNEYAGYGIPYYLSDSERKINQKYNLSYLTGISGVGLSLLSSIYSLDAFWDKYLLLS